jgi:O-acetylserine/cysteine efflux transporter
LKGAQERLPARDLALAVLIAALWGFSFIAIKAGVAEAPPLTFTALRFLLAAFPAVLFVPRPKARLRDIAAYGLCIGVGQFGLLFIAIKYGMPAGLASLVIQIQSVFTILLAWIALGQRPRAAQLIGAGVALSGVALIGASRGGLGAGDAAASGGFAAPVLPFVAVVGAAMFWAAGNLFSIRAGKVHMPGFIAWSSLVSPAPLLALSWALDDHAAILRALTHPSLAVWGGAAFLAYGATMIGFGLWSWLLSRHPVAQVAPFSLLVPVFGLSGAALVFGETLDGLIVLGIGVVLGGLAVAVLGPRRGRA